MDVYIGTGPFNISNLDSQIDKRVDIKGRKIVRDGWNSRLVEGMEIAIWGGMWHDDRATQVR